MCGGDLFTGCGTAKWHAIYTSSRQEKSVAARLQAQGIEAYVPCLRAARQRKNGVNVIVDVPLFPGYVFACIERATRVRVLRLPGVVGFVEGLDGPVEVCGKQLEAVRLSLDEYEVAPHAYLEAGRVANVIRGPLAGRKGIVPAGQPRASVVFNLDGLGLAIAVSVNPGDVESAASDA